MKPGFDFVGVSIAFFCTDGSGRFLMHKRSQNTRDEQGRWEFGGGQLEFGETPQQGVLREVQEEYGCAGKILAELPYFSHHREHNGQPTHWLILPFIIRVAADEAKLNEPASMDEIGWFTFDSLPEPLHTGAARYVPIYQEHLQELVL